MARRRKKTLAEEIRESSLNPALSRGHALAGHRHVAEIYGGEQTRHLTRWARRAVLGLR